jgi:hypothetical protein
MLSRGFARIGLAALVAASGLYGCDDSGGGAGPTDAARFDAAIIDGGQGGAGGGSGGAGGGGAGGGPTEEHLRLSYIKSFVPANGEPSVDLVLYDFNDAEEFNLTSGSDVVCDVKTCRLNGDQTFIGWMDRDPEGGFKLFVAPVDVARKLVKDDQKREVADQVTNFAFTADLIVYSRGEAIGPNGELDVIVEPVAGEAEGCPDLEDRTQCKQPVGAINGDGGFRVTDFGSLIILIRTTLSTMTLDFFNVRNGANQTLFTFGQQGGTGSQFSGRQPVGLSPDATFLAVFTDDEFVWQLHNLQAIPNPPEPTNHELFEVETSDNDCQRPMPYTFNEVRFDPIFSEDANFIYFLAVGDCARRAADNPTNRDDHDILRIDRNLGEVTNVTNNVRASNWINHDIGDFDLSPDGSRLAFTASRPDKASSSSIWLIDPETGVYDCDRGSRLTSLDGKERCEFVFDDSNGAAVNYRDVKFHKVDVPR